MGNLFFEPFNKQVVCHRISYMHVRCVHKYCCINKCNKKYIGRWSELGYGLSIHLAHPDLITIEAKSGREGTIKLNLHVGNLENQY